MGRWGGATRPRSVSGGGASGVAAWGAGGVFCPGPASVAPRQSERAAAPIRRCSDATTPRVCVRVRAFVCVRACVRVREHLGHLVPCPRTPPSHHQIRYVCDHFIFLSLGHSGRGRGGEGKRRQSLFRRRPLIGSYKQRPYRIYFA